LIAKTGGTSGPGGLNSTRI